MRIAQTRRRQKMIKPLTSQIPVALTWSGQLDDYRSGKAGRVINGGNVRQIDGFAIDVSGTSSYLAIPMSFAAAPGITVVKDGEIPSALAPSTMAASIH